MDRYGGYVYKSYTAYTDVKPTPISRDGGLGPHLDNRGRTSSVPANPIRETIPSDDYNERNKGLLHPLPHTNEKDNNLTGKIMVDVAYSSYPTKNDSLAKVDQPTKDYKKFIKKVHDECNQLSKSVAPSNWHQSPYSTGGHGITKNDVYDDYHRKNDNSKELNPMDNGGLSNSRHSTWESPPNHSAQFGEPIYHINKSSLDSFKEPTKFTSSAAQSIYPNEMNGHGDYGYGYYDDHHRKYDRAATMEPTTDSWIRPNAATWTPTPRNGTQLSQTTNDIDKVLGMLKEVAHPTSVPMGAYPETTHNRNGGRRYGNFKFSSQPR